MSYRRRTSPAETSELLILVGAAFAVLGGWIPWMGHAPYYLAAGVALIGAGTLMLWSRLAGLGWYFCAFVAALVWAIVKGGIHGWNLLPRLLVFALLGIGFSLTMTANRPRAGAQLRFAGVTTAIVYALTIAGMISLALS